MSDALFNIPQELRNCPQWIMWRYEDRDKPKPTKVPYSPHYGREASVTNPAHWSTFQHCYEVLQNTTGYAGVGFVFTEGDPFCGIDLDETTDADVYNAQRKIYDAFNSYSELSPSGKGAHIICRGHAVSGRRRHSVELYPHGRFFTMTGNVINVQPIIDRQSEVQQLWAELGGKTEQTFVAGSMTEPCPDAEVIARAKNAANGDKFDRLWVGDWEREYASQSEADQALMNFLAFYTQNRSQLMRMFRASALGAREKAQRNAYLNYTINRAFDELLPPINFDALKNRIADILAKKAETPATIHVQGNRSEVNSAGASRIEETPTVSAAVNTKQHPADAPKQDIAPNLPPINPPPGMIGELAQFIYSASTRPVPEIALTAAIGLFAGVCGRSYNVSGTGTNMYILLLADTGTGKEAMAQGIEKFMSAVTNGVDPDSAFPAMPAAREFQGPAEISSGQALIKHFNTQRSFISVVGEFGLKMKQLAHPRASSAEILLKRALLDLFNKSGQGNVLRPTIYSEKEKNTDAVEAPALTILGETVPEHYYGAIDETMISDGLLPRFLHIEYRGPRPPTNRQAPFARPSAELVRKFSDLVDNSLKLNASNHVITVRTCPQAEQFLDDVDKFADDKINQPDQADAVRQIWNRTHLKTLKLAALVAIGCDIMQPTITQEIAEWAFDVVKRDALAIVDRFDRGEFGGTTDENSQVRDMSKVMAQYCVLPFSSLAKYRISRDMHNDKVIPYSFLQRRLATLAAYRADRMGPTNAIRKTLQILTDSGAIQEVGKTDLQKYGTRAKCYVIADANQFNFEDV